MINKPGKSRRPNSIPNEGNGGDYEQARIRRETAMAELAELELATKKNQVIPADMVERHWCNMVAMTRAKLLGLPSRLAAVLQSCQTPQEIEREAMILVREALTELSENGNPKKSTKPLVD